MIVNQIFKIRSVQEHELFDAVSLELSCGLSTGGVNRFRRMLVDSSGILLGAFNKANVSGKQPIVGLICGTVVLDEFQIDNLVVKEDFRRRGLGTELVKTRL